MSAGATTAAQRFELLRQLAAVDDEAACRRLVQGALSSAADVEALLVALKDESERTWRVDPYASLRLADALVTAAEVAGKSHHRALGLMAKADALMFLGRYPEAVHVSDEAAAAFLALQDEVGWARTRIGWVMCSHRTGRGAEALEVVDRARDVLVRHDELLRAARLDMNAAIVCKDLGRYDQALRLYVRAQEGFEAAGQIAELQAAVARTNRANLLSLLGDFAGSLALSEEARAVAARHGETVTVLQQTQNIAYVYGAQGHYTRALALLLEVFDGHQRAGVDLEVATVALDIVECQLALNRVDEAREYADLAVERFDRLGAVTEAAKARFCSSLVYSRLGDTDRALELLDEAAATFASAQLLACVGDAALHRGSLHLAEARWAAAAAAARRAHALFAERSLPVRQAQAAVVLARALFELGERGDATSYARSAVAIARERDVPWLAHQAHHVLASVARGEGDDGIALVEYLASIESIERVQSRLAIELRTNFLGDKLEVYHDAVDCALRLGQPERAFEFLERAKSRALVDYLTANPDVRLQADDAGSQALLDELARLRAEHSWYYNRLYGYSANLPPDGGRDERDGRVDELQQQGIRQREKRIARILERLALRAGERLEEVTAPGAGVAPARPSLDSDSVLLEYYFRKNAGAVLVLTQHQLHVVELSARPGDIQRLLYQWQLNLDAATRLAAQQQPLDTLARNTGGILQALYRALIEPVAGHLAGKTRLIVVPYGPTHAVPFHALHDGRQHLVETVEVSVCPSSTLLRLCSRRHPRRGASGLVVAFSDAGRLPRVLDEAAAIASLLPGERLIEAEATAAAVLAAAPHHGVLHFATHAEARLDDPTFAHLKLADGQLTAVDVFNLRLEGALVTLSACETGRSVVAGGDELVGLSRGFLFAGASTLVQSLWRVEDGSTARLMGTFYAGLRAGRRKGAALRQAQLALMADGGGHPYYWAPFQLVGADGLL